MHRQSGNRAEQDVHRGVDGVRARRERAIAEVASRQRGVVTRRQLRAAGLTTNAIDYRLRSARLHVLYRGVYMLGHARPAEGAREFGAVLACGPGAALSHRSAAGLWRLFPPSRGEIDVTVSGRRCDSKRGIRVHRVDTLDRRDVRKLGGIPVTAPARTILDLAGVVGARELEQAMAEAQARRLVRRSDLLALLAVIPADRGSPRCARCSTPTTPRP
jgi:Transcriptional regulator, AbiEi antitoxin